MAGKELSQVPDSGRTDYFEIRAASLRAPVRLEYPAIRDLRAALDANTEGLGLLLGGSSPHAISIHRCELLALSAATTADPKSLQAACRQFIRARLQTPLEDAPALLGFFRTQPGGAARLRDSDLEIAQTNFPGLDALFLLVQTPADRPWLASLYVLDGKTGAGPAELTHEFPFDEYLLRNGFVSALVEAPPPAVPPGLLPGPENKRRMIIGAAALLAVVLAGAAAYNKWYSPLDRAGAARNATGAGSLNLKVNRSGKDFEISWNLLSPSIQQASGGNLTIQDGALTRPVALTGPQLREGRILYTPLFDELNFRLEVTSPNLDPVAESVQVLAWSGKQQAETLVVAPAQPATNSPARIVTADSARTLPPVLPGVNAPSLRKETSPITGTPQTAKAAPAAPTPAATLPATSKGPAASKGNEVASVRSSPTPAPPSVVSPAPSNSSPARETAPVPPARAPDVPPQTPTPAAAPERPPAIQTSPQLPLSPPTSQAPRVPEPEAAVPPVRQNSAPPAAAASLPPSTPSAGGVAIPPVPIQRVTPVLPRTLAGARFSQAVTVSVRMMVDSAGSVQSAQVMASTPKGAFGEATIHKAILDAAKNWKFRPGQLNGKNVAAEYDINFKF